jgi:hypothetical protein
MPSGLTAHSPQPSTSGSPRLTCSTHAGFEQKQAAGAGGGIGWLMGRCSRTEPALAVGIRRAFAQRFADAACAVRPRLRQTRMASTGGVASLDPSSVCRPPEPDAHAEDPSMPHDAESPDPLEDLLADWFAGAMLASQPPPDADEVSGYVTELDVLADARLRARRLAHAQCGRLYARLERRLIAHERVRRPRARAGSSLPVARPAAGMSARFELSI